jgi:hypothetical protein
MSSALRKRTGCRCTVCPGLSCAVLCCPVLSLDSLDAQHSGALRPPLITLPQPAPSHAALHFPPLRTLRTPHPEPSSHAARTVCHPSSILVSGLAPSGVLSLKQYVTHRQNDPQRLPAVAITKHARRDTSVLQNTAASRSLAAEVWRLLIHRCITSPTDCLWSGFHGLPSPPATALALPSRLPAPPSTYLIALADQPPA